MSILRTLSLYLVYSSIMASTIGLELITIKYVELNDSKLIATSNFNYAISSPKLLAKDWRTISVNGDAVRIISPNGEETLKTKADLSDEDRVFIEILRNELTSSNAGYIHVINIGSGGNIISSSNSGGDSTSTTFSSAGGFTTRTGDGTSQLQANDMTINVRDENNFSISKSNLPFGWSRVFINSDLVTLVNKQGEVEMRPINTLDAIRLEIVNKLIVESKEFQRVQSQQITNTMQQSVDMVSNIFGNIMGRFPKPPDYNSVVGSAFGDNFPFGPNNSPFNAASGWPFSNGAFAFAG